MNSTAVSITITSEEEETAYQAFDENEPESNNNEQPGRHVRQMRAAEASTATASSSVPQITPPPVAPLPDKNHPSLLAPSEEDGNNEEPTTDFEAFEDEHDDTEEAPTKGPQNPTAAAVMTSSATCTVPEPVSSVVASDAVFRPSTATSVEILSQPTLLLASDSNNDSFSCASTSLQTFASMPPLATSSSLSQGDGSLLSAPSSRRFLLCHPRFTATAATATATTTTTASTTPRQVPALSRSSSLIGGVDRLPGAHQRCWQSCPRIILPKKIQTPQFRKGVAVLALVVFVAVGLWTAPYGRQQPDHLRVAFIGNSMMYYNDMPRFMEALSGHSIEQDACLHGDATLHSILVSGSGTYKIWRTGVAQIRDVNMTYLASLNDQYSNNNNNNQNNSKKKDFSRLYDYGACTVPQLLFGYDTTLDQKMQDWNFDRSYQSHGDDYFDDDDYYTMDNDEYDFESFMDGLNPCLMDPNYYQYRKYMYLQRKQHYYGGNDDDDDDDDGGYGNMDHYYNKEYDGRIPTPPHWDYIIINDNTRTPAQYQGRRDSLSILEQQYLLWFMETGATPVLMFTYAYDTPYRDMQGMLDIPTFTSLTYEGYRQYAQLLAQRLPENQQPRIAMVGLAFLTIWEEQYDFWYERLFHVDRIHASPHGTFLQGCVVYCTLYGRLPPKSTAIDKLSTLWNNARRMAPVRHRRAKFPTKEEALYLYHIAERVCLQGHVPKSFTFYEHEEATDYIPTDDIYKDADLY